MLAHRFGVFLTITLSLLIAPFASAQVDDASAPKRARSTLDPQALEALVRGAEKSHSTALVVMQDGELVGEWTFGKPTKKVQTNSATKSLVSMAIGKLIDMGKIKSIDQPVYEFFPEWQQGRKSKVTIRHLLTHTSGMEESYTTPWHSADYLKTALAADIHDDPGTVYVYNNKAMLVLGGIIEKASGKKLDEFVKDEFFVPLGISDTDWLKDEIGRPHAHYGLTIHARDLAKVGTLMANEGRWQGKQLLSARWVAQSAQLSTPLNPAYGLLWWRVFDREVFVIDETSVERVAKAGGDAEMVAKTKKLIGRYDGVPARRKAIRSVFKGNEALKLRELRVDPLWRAEHGTQIGYVAVGALGQFLFVLPKQKLVVVRLIENSPTRDNETDGFDEIWTLVAALTKSSTR